MRDKMVNVKIARRGETDVSVKLPIVSYCQIGIRSGRGGEGVHEYCENLLKEGRKGAR